MKKPFWNYDRATSLWAKWHCRVCIPLRRHGAGLNNRKGLLGWLGKVQLPFCRFLDDWSHNCPDHQSEAAKAISERKSV